MRNLKWYQQEITSFHISTKTFFNFAPLRSCLEACATDCLTFWATAARFHRGHVLYYHYFLLKMVKMCPQPSGAFQVLPDHGLCFTACSVTVELHSHHLISCISSHVVHVSHILPFYNKKMHNRASESTPLWHHWWVCTHCWSHPTTILSDGGSLEMQHTFLPGVKLLLFSLAYKTFSTHSFTKKDIFNLKTQKWTWAWEVKPFLSFLLVPSMFTFVSATSAEKHQPAPRY